MQHFKDYKTYYFLNFDTMYQHDCHDTVFQDWGLNRQTSSKDDIITFDVLIFNVHRFLTLMIHRSKFPVFNKYKKTIIFSKR